MKRLLPAIFLLFAATVAAHAQIDVGSATPKTVGNADSVFPEQGEVFPDGAPGLIQTRNGDVSTERRELGPVMGFVRNSQGYESPIDGVVTKWAQYDSWTYKGEMFMTAGTTYTFATMIDDSATIDIDGANVLTQNGFTAASYACTSTGWHDITIRLRDVGGNYGYWSDFPLGIAYNTAGQTSRNPLSGWTQLVDPGDGSLFRTGIATTIFHSGVRVAAQMRESDPTVMDVTYIVYTDPETTPTVNVRALAFEDGERGFATVIRPETFIEGTEVNLGDGIAANVEHKLSWKVSSDWATDLAKVKFEVMAMKPDDLLLPNMHFVTIPAAEGHPTTIVSVNDLSKDAYEITRDENYYNGIYSQWGNVNWRGITGNRPLLNALFWLYASVDMDLVLSDGVLCANNNVLVRHAGFSNNYTWSTCEDAVQYVFGKMGYRLLEDETELAWVNENTRLGLKPQQFRQYAVKTEENNNVEISRPGFWQTTLSCQSSIDQTVDIYDYPVYRVLGPVMAFTGGTYTDSGTSRSWTWAENTVFVYRGQMRMEFGTTYTFGSNIDDWCLVKIDGTEVIRNEANSFSSGSYSCSETGWHDIEIRVGNARGQGGAGGSNGWKSNVGIGYNISGLSSENDGNGWTRLVDPGDGSLLRTSGVIPKCVVFDPE